MPLPDFLDEPEFEVLLRKYHLARGIFTNDEDEGQKKAIAKIKDYVRSHIRAIVAVKPPSEDVRGI